MRILAVITGIALMLTGIWTFTFMGLGFPSIAFVVGCVMVSAGFLCMLVYFFAPGKHDGFGWFFAEGLVTAILGGIVLANLLVVDSMIPLFFGMWILFCGTLRVVASLHSVMHHNNSWVLTLIFGGVSIAAGVFSFHNQLSADISMMILIGSFFLIQGINVLVYGVFIPGKKKSKNR